MFAKIYNGRCKSFAVTISNDDYETMKEKCIQECIDNPEISIDVFTYNFDKSISFSDPILIEESLGSENRVLHIFGKEYFHTCFITAFHCSMDNMPSEKSEETVINGWRSNYFDPCICGEKIEIGR